jgi:hypothetical protein
MCSPSHCKAEAGRNSIGPCRILKRFRSTGVLADVARLDTVEVQSARPGHNGKKPLRWLGAEVPTDPR